MNPARLQKTSTKRFQRRGARAGRQHAADRPRLAAVLGDDPAEFRRDPWQRDTAEGNSEQPALRRHIAARQKIEGHAKTIRIQSAIPTISRNDQNSGGHAGMVDAAACLICSGSRRPRWERIASAKAIAQILPGFLRTSAFASASALALLSFAAPRTRGCRSRCVLRHSCARWAIPSTGLSIERVAIRPSSQGMWIANREVSVFSSGMPKTMNDAGGVCVTHSASITAILTFCTSPVV